MKYQLVKGKYVPLEGGKYCDKVGEVFDEGDCDPSDINLLLRQGAIAKHTTPTKATKEVSGSTFTKPGA